MTSPTSPTPPLTVHQRIGALVKFDPWHRTQRKWAKLLGLSPASLSDRINGRVPFSLVEAEAIAHALDLSLDELVHGEDLPIGYVLATSGATA